jgi:hypothetical protein
MTIQRQSSVIFLPRLVSLYIFREVTVHAFLIPWGLKSSGMAPGFQPQFLLDHTCEMVGPARARVETSRGTEESWM